MRYKAKSAALMGMCVALAMIFSYIEVLLPPLVAAVPGVKIGLANVVTIFVLYRYGAGRAALVSFVRILLMFLLFGNLLSLAYSLAGAILSISVMLVLKRTRLFSGAAVSAMGGVAHNIGQLIIAMFIIESYSVINYLPVLMIAGIICGLIVGIVAWMVIKYVNVIFRKRDII